MGNTGAQLNQSVLVKKHSSTQVVTDIHLSVRPSSPDIIILVDGDDITDDDTAGVMPGQDIVIECEATGNPTPDITIIINGVKTGETGTRLSRHSFQTVENSSHRFQTGRNYSHLNISCTAVNKVSTVFSDIHSLQVLGKYHSPSTCVTGPKVLAS